MPCISRWRDERSHQLRFAARGCRCLRSRGTDPDAGSIFADYQKVNLVLESIESEVRQSLLEDLEQQLGHPLEPLQHLISSWSIGSAREAAWVRAKALWHLRDVQVLFDQIVNVSASAAGMTSQQLLTPLLPLDV